MERDGERGVMVRMAGGRDGDLQNGRWRTGGTFGRLCRARDLAVVRDDPPRSAARAASVRAGSHERTALTPERMLRSGILSPFFRNPEMPNWNSISLRLSPKKEKGKEAFVRGPGLWTGREEACELRAAAANHI